MKQKKVSLVPSLLWFLLQCNFFTAIIQINLSSSLSPKPQTQTLTPSEIITLTLSHGVLSSSPAATVLRRRTASPPTSFRWTRRSWIALDRRTRRPRTRQGIRTGPSGDGLRGRRFSLPRPISRAKAWTRAPKWLSSRRKPLKLSRCWNRATGRRRWRRWDSPRRIITGELGFQNFIFKFDRNIFENIWIFAYHIISRCITDIRNFLDWDMLSEIYLQSFFCQHGWEWLFVWN